MLKITFELIEVKSFMSSVVIVVFLNDFFYQWQCYIGGCVCVCFDGEGVQLNPLKFRESLLHVDGFATRPASCIY